MSLKCPPLTDPVSVHVSRKLCRECNEITLLSWRPDAAPDPLSATDVAKSRLVWYCLPSPISAASTLAIFKYLQQQIGEIDRELALQLADDDAGQRLMGIPGVGPMTTSVLAAEIGDVTKFRCGRDFAASVGLVPRQYSTGGRSNLLGISRRGHSHIRSLLVQCARAYMRFLHRRTGHLAEWARALASRRHSNVAACAVANKLARIAWAIVARHTSFNAGPATLPV